MPPNSPLDLVSSQFSLIHTASFPSISSIFNKLSLNAPPNTHISIVDLYQVYRNYSKFKTYLPSLALFYSLNSTTPPPLIRLLSLLPISFNVSHAIPPDTSLPPSTRTMRIGHIQDSKETLTESTWITVDSIEAVEKYAAIEWEAEGVLVASVHGWQNIISKGMKTGLNIRGLRFVGSTQMGAERVREIVGMVTVAMDLGCTIDVIHLGEWASMNDGTDRPYFLSTAKEVEKEVGALRKLGVAEIWVSGEDLLMAGAKVEEKRFGDVSDRMVKCVVGGDRDGFEVEYRLDQIEGKGWGIVLMERVKKGDVVWRFKKEGEAWRRYRNEHEFRRRVEELEKIGKDEAGWFLNHVFGWNGDMIEMHGDGRFLNHSRNAAIKSFDGECWRAVKDLEIGDEIDDNYAAFDNPSWYVELCNEYGVDCAAKVVENIDSLN